MSYLVHSNTKINILKKVQVANSWNESISIHVLLTATRWTHASYLDILKRKLVVVRQLLTSIDRPQCKDNHMFLPGAVVHDLRVAVGFTRVVDESSGIAGNGGVNDGRLAQSKHVAAVVAGAVRPRTIIHLFPPVCQYSTYHLASILNHHLTGSNVATCVQSQSVNWRPIHSHGVLHRRAEMTETHCHW